MNQRNIDGISGGFGMTALGLDHCSILDLMLVKRTKKSTIKNKLSYCDSESNSYSNRDSINNANPEVSVHFK